MNFVQSNLTIFKTKRVMEQWWTELYKKSYYITMNEKIEHYDYGQKIFEISHKLIKYNFIFTFWYESLSVSGNM